MNILGLRVPVLLLFAKTRGEFGGTAPRRRDLGVRADEDTQRRYDGLAERNSEGGLIPEEQQELASLVRANLIVSVLKAEARAYLLHQPAT